MSNYRLKRAEHHTWPQPAQTGPRSVLIQRPHANPSKAGGLPPALPRRWRLALWSVRSGMTARMPRRRRSCRTSRDEYALSAMTVSGLWHGRPAPVRGTRTDSSTALNTVQSLTLPGVRMTARGRPRPSQARWTLVVSPPRERPCAWSAPSVPNLPARRSRPPPFPGAGRVLVGAVDGGVHRHRPFRRSDGVVACLNQLQEAGPGPVPLPTGEPLINRLPRPGP